MPICAFAAVKIKMTNMRRFIISAMMVVAAVVAVVAQLRTTETQIGRAHV